MHFGSQFSGVSFGNAGDQVGGPSESRRSRKATNNRDDLQFQIEWFQRFINRLFVVTLPREPDVLAGPITDGSDFASGQRMPHAHDTEVTISEYCLHTQFRSSRFLDNTSFQIHRSVARGHAFFVRLLHEA
jgi:hypothetical protein